MPESAGAPPTITNENSSFVNNSIIISFQGDYNAP